MTYQFPEDSSLDNLLKMTNDVMMKIKTQSQEIYQ
jgi:hypothetical protein